MINNDFKITLTRQAELLSLNRSTLYYVPKPMNDNDLSILRKLDELHLQYPFMGSRMLQNQLNRQGVKIGRLHTKTLMNIANIHAISRQKLLTLQSGYRYFRFKGTRMVTAGAFCHNFLLFLTSSQRHC